MRTYLIILSEIVSQEHDKEFGNYVVKNNFEFWRYTPLNWILLTPDFIELNTLTEEIKRSYGEIFQCVLEIDIKHVKGLKPYNYLPKIGENNPFAWFDRIKDPNFMPQWETIEDSKKFVDEKINQFKKEFPNHLYIIENIIGRENNNNRKFPVLIGLHKDYFNLSFIIEIFEEKYCLFFINYINHKKNSNDLTSQSIPVRIEKGRKMVTTSQPTISNPKFSNKIYIFANSIIGDKDKFVFIFKQNGYFLQFK